MKKSASPFPVDPATFEAAAAAGRVPPVRIPASQGIDGVGTVWFDVLEAPAPHQLAPGCWSADRWLAAPEIRWAHSWLIGRATAPERTETRVSTGPIEFIARDVFEPAWAVGELFRRGLLTCSSVAFMPASWSKLSDGGLLFLRQELLDLSAVPNFAPSWLDRARDLPLDWLKAWVEKVLDDAATSDEARLRLVCHPDRLVELHAALASPAVQVPGGSGDDDLLVARVDQLERTMGRLIEAVQDQTAVLRQLAASSTHFLQSTEAPTPTHAPANGTTTESRG